MSAEKPHNENTGVLFTNSDAWKKEKAGRPDFSGEITVEGKRFRLSAWNKISKSTGRAFLSLALTEDQ